MSKRGKRLLIIGISIYAIACALCLLLMLYAFGVFYQDIEISVNIKDCDRNIWAGDDYIEIYSLISNTEFTYQHQFPDVYEEVEDLTGGWDGYVVSDDYAVSIIKCDGMHHFYLKKHILDELLYLNNDTGCAEVVYECAGYNRILFAYDDVVVIYNGERNSMQYISLIDDTILYETVLNLDQTRSKYSVDINLSAGTIEITRIRQILPFESFTLPIWRE